MNCWYSVLGGNPWVSLVTLIIYEHVFLYMVFLTHCLLGGLSWYISSDRYILLFNRDDNTVNKLLETPALWLGNWQQLQKLQDQAERQTQALENLFAGFPRAALSLPPASHCFLSDQINISSTVCELCVLHQLKKHSLHSKTIPSLVRRRPLFVNYNNTCAGTHNTFRNSSSWMWLRILS